MDRSSTCVLARDASWSDRNLSMGCQKSIGKPKEPRKSGTRCADLVFLSQKIKITTTNLRYASENLSRWSRHAGNGRRWPLLYPKRTVDYRLLSTVGEEVGCFFMTWHVGPVSSLMQMQPPNPTTEQTELLMLQIVKNIWIYSSTDTWI